MKLTNEEIAAECAAAQARYGALSIHDAQVTFSYEMQGFVAAMVGKGMEFPIVLTKIEGLLAILADANAS